MREKQILSDWDLRISELNYNAEIKTPHTWNVCEETQNYRGRADYTTDVFIDKDKQNHKVTLYFGAVYHTADVFVNDTYIGTHSGSGYTPFSFDITDSVFFGCKNQIKVVVDNSPSPNMLPYMKNFDWADDG